MKSSHIFKEFLKKCIHLSMEIIIIFTLFYVAFQ